MRTLTNVLGFQANWFACVLGAAWGWPWLGLITVAVLVGAHVAFAPSRAGEAKLLGGAAVFGLAGEWLLHRGAVTGYPPQAVWLGETVPLWMIALWIGFATTLHFSMSWLQGRYLTAALAGAAAGPLSYWGGQRLGAISLHPEPLVWVIGIGLLWAVATPLLLALAEATRA